MQAGPVHESLKPLVFLIGKWQSVSAKGYYPTINPFSYCDEVEFTSLGQPILNYSSKTWHPVKKNPMHLETGFLRIKPGSNSVSLLVAHNFGVTTIEEGCVEGNEIRLKSTEISRMFFVKEPYVTEIERHYKLNDKCQLEFTMSMATCSTVLTEHLKVLYERVSD